MNKTAARRILTLSLIGAGAFALSACRDEEVNARSFRDAQACIDAGNPREICDAEFQAALDLHEETAPRYEDRALCEEEHGIDACTESPAQAGGQSSFMPFLMGYMMARAIGGGSALAPTPLYRTPTGAYASANSQLRVPSIGAATTARASAFAPPPSTLRAAPMTRANVSARGGFGSSRAVSFGG